MVFLVVNVLTIGGLLLYTGREGRRANEVDQVWREALGTAEDRAGAAVALLKDQLREGFERELALVLAGNPSEPEPCVRW